MAECDFEYVRLLAVVLCLQVLLLGVQIDSSVELTRLAGCTEVVWV